MSPHRRVPRSESGFLLVLVAVTLLDGGSRIEARNNGVFSGKWTLWNRIRAYRFDRDRPKLQVDREWRKIGPQYPPDARERVKAVLDQYIDRQ